MTHTYKHESAIVSLLILTLLSCGGSGNGGTGSSSGGGAGVGTPAPAEVLYLVSGENLQQQIWSFNINTDTGLLSAAKKFPTVDPLNQIKADPAGNFLYTSDFVSGKVHAYAINAVNGNLAETNGSPFSPVVTISGNGGPLAITPNGKFLFIANGNGDISSFSVAGGALTATGSIEDGSHLEGLVVDPSGKFLVTANQTSFLGSEFSVFSIDSASGTLTATAHSPFRIMDNSSPFGIVAHPNGKFVYSTLSNTTMVAGFSLDIGTGDLTGISGSPFNSGRFIPQGIAMHPSGKFLYITAVEGNAIISFSVDAGSGALTKLGEYDGNSPVSLAIEPSGKFLYASDPDLNQVEMYKIDQASGALTALTGSPVSAGADVGAMAIVKLP